MGLFMWRFYVAWFCMEFGVGVGCRCFVSCIRLVGINVLLCFTCHFVIGLSMFGGLPLIVLNCLVWFWSLVGLSLLLGGCLVLRLVVRCLTGLLFVCVWCECFGDDWG